MGSCGAVYATTLSERPAASSIYALPQQNIKRLLAYSGIAHIGYMLIGFAAVSAEASP